MNSFKESEMQHSLLKCRDLAVCNLKQWELTPALNVLNHESEQSNYQMPNAKYEMNISDHKSEGTNNTEFEAVYIKSGNNPLEFADDANCKNMVERSVVSNKQDFLPRLNDVYPSENTVNRKGHYLTEDTSGSQHSDMMVNNQYLQNIFNGMKDKLDRILHPGNIKFYWCSCCYKCFTHKPEFNKHLLTHSKQKIHKCMKCNMFFTKGSLQYHLKNICKICQKCFTRRRLLEDHLLVHEGNKTYECQNCGKFFSQKRLYKNHVFIHTQPKKYLCDMCGKCFANRKNLKKHILYVHNAKKNKCETCHKYFYSKSYLKQHSVVHTGIKKFVCLICDKRFSFSRCLQNHLVIHEGSKKFSCELCKKSFNRKDNLKVHILGHYRSSLK